MPESKKQLKHTVNYRGNETETDLYNWVEEKGKIIGAVNYIKQVLYDKKQEEEKNK